MTDTDTSTETNGVTVGGTKTPCTREEFDKQIYGRIYSQCDLKDVGTFYFVLQGINL